jgi:hypothetical protein
MHSTLGGEVPYLLARERDPAMESLGAGMFYARHGTICIPQGSGFYADLQKVRAVAGRPCPRRAPAAPTGLNRSGVESPTPYYPVV